MAGEERDPDRGEVFAVTARENETPKIAPVEEDCCGEARPGSAERAYWIGISALVILIVLGSFLAGLFR